MTVGWSIYSRAPDASTGTIAAVRRVDFELRVDSVGVLDAARAHTYASAMRGDKGKIIQIAQDGARVSSDDVLVRFDATSLEADAQRLAADLRTREAASAYVKQALEVEKSQIERAMSSAELAARSAREEVGRHQAYIDDLEGLGRRGVPVASEAAQAARKLHQARVQLDKAEGDLALLRKEGVHRLAQAMAEVAKAESEASNIRYSLELVREEMARTVLRATGPGFVVLNETAVNDRKRRLRVGDTVWQGQPILYLPDLSEMIVRTRIREEDLHKIREGQEATIRVEAYPDTLLKGRVRGIGALALESAGTSAAGKFFQVSLEIEARDDRLRPGMTARVMVMAERATGVLAVPLPAIFYSDEQAICFVLEGNRAIPRPVRLGRRGDDLVEVIAGLTEGERVSLVKP